MFTACNYNIFWNGIQLIRFISNIFFLWYYFITKGGFYMKKIAVLCKEGFEEIEALTPVDILRRAGVHVD